MIRPLIIAALALAGSSVTPFAAAAQETVECQSRNYQYDECYAGPLARPQLIHQISTAPCILNRTWGYNPKSKYVWVAQGCAGVFADVRGYHYGRGDDFDADARMYDHRGHDVGKVVAGAVLGAIISGIAQDGGRHHHHFTSNIDESDDSFTSCHGIGCTVDDPGDHSVDTTPQFDKNGEPNFDTQGNYQGCHGVGCLVDNPDSAN